MFNVRFRISQGAGVHTRQHGSAGFQLADFTPIRFTCIPKQATAP